VSNADEIRRRQRLESFRRTQAQLERACDKREYSEFERAGLVKIFEFTLELGWKTLKDLLFYEGRDARPTIPMKAACATGRRASVQPRLETVKSSLVCSQHTEGMP
jgi:hypothetical protein